MENPNNERPMNVQEAANYLRIPTACLYKKTAAGKITHYKPDGGRIFFLKSDLDSYIQRGRVPGSYEVERAAAENRASRNHRGA